jgi:hypothetical protein
VISTEASDGVRIIRMTGDANLFDDRFLADLNAAFDAVVADDKSTALVLTGGQVLLQRVRSRVPRSVQGPVSWYSSATPNCSSRPDVSRADRAIVNGRALGIAASRGRARRARHAIRPGLVLLPRSTSVSRSSRS